MTEQEATYKIDATGSSWFGYAVYKRGLFGWWWKVKESCSLKVCEEFVAESMILPKYY